MYLFDRIKESFEKLDQNNISFITFNYDRSLEHFLFEAIRNLFGKETEECAEKIEKIPIVHLYGQLNHLPWQEVSGMVYSPNENLTYRLKTALYTIKLISDERDVDSSEEFQKAYKLIEDAQHLYFLGFGFDETNLKRLQKRWGQVCYFAPGAGKHNHKTVSEKFSDELKRIKTGKKG